MNSLENNDEAGDVSAVNGTNPATNQDAKVAETEEKAISKPAKTDQREPEWASGLKQLYNSVVDEPIPDMFKDLLAKLDDGGK
ncbi:hypothetical protein GRI97_02860 [Altererythrobacter xixiisoli]|uniref:Anti-sigma factor NepR domain-containing protein n=1 Tax=Croceibacterium xixiisoli TaxID=1476466 RepID=A0A6I4TRJ3_9SPHN|nr:NepR family anti-sigma factor [Croceibacterium xixiisoli]MXO97929.1 hypothetical protein [Croceibacterium xixiisoli]